MLELTRAYHSPSPVASPQFSVHRNVIAILALLVGALSLFLWIHPSAGYAQGGILDGADLRTDLIKISWTMAIAFAAASTAVIASVSQQVQAAVRYTLAYSLGTAAAAGALVLLDTVH